MWHSSFGFIFLSFVSNCGNGSGYQPCISQSIKHSCISFPMLTRVAARFPCFPLCDSSIQVRPSKLCLCHLLPVICIRRSLLATQLLVRGSTATTPHCEGCFGSPYHFAAPLLECTRQRALIKALIEMWKIVTVGLCLSRKQMTIVPSLTTKIYCDASGSCQLFQSHSILMLGLLTIQIFFTVCSSSK